MRFFPFKATLMALLLSCGGTPSLEVPEVFHVDSEATDEQRWHIVAGFEWARQHMPPLANSRLAFDRDHTHSVTYGHIGLRPGQGGQARLGCAITVGVQGTISWVVAHELGHCAGMGHVDEPAALMYPWYDPDVTKGPVWTDADQEECDVNCRYP